MKAQSFLLTSFLIILFSSKGFCCINEFWQLLNGKLHEVAENNSPFEIPKPKNFQSADIMRIFKETEMRYNKSPTLENYSDYAAILIYKGKYQKAKSILLEIESKSPNKYNTAANLGTVYELLGQNDSAYFWIKKGIEINPYSHFGSEWIHLRILEEKIKAGSDVSYFDTHSILKIDFGLDSLPKSVPIESLDDYSKELYYQLSERMSFIKPQDPIIAQLCFDLANIHFLQGLLHQADETFQRAIRYGFKGDVLEKRKVYLRHLIDKGYGEDSKFNIATLQTSETPNDSSNSILLISLGSLLSFVSVYKFIKNRS